MDALRSSRFVSHPGTFCLEVAPCVAMVVGVFV
jgi:hypothetical protein